MQKINNSTSSLDISQSDKNASTENSATVPRKISHVMKSIESLSATITTRKPHKTSFSYLPEKTKTSGTDSQKSIDSLEVPSPSSNKGIFCI